MNCNVVYIIVGVLAVATIILGYQLYEERHTTGIEINVGKNSISVEKR